MSKQTFMARLTGVIRDVVAANNNKPWNPDVSEGVDPWCEVEAEIVGDDPASPYSGTVPVKVVRYDGTPMPWYAAAIAFWGTLKVGVSENDPLTGGRTYTVDSGYTGIAPQTVVLRTTRNGTEPLLCLEIPRDVVFHAVVLGLAAPSTGAVDAPLGLGDPEHGPGVVFPGDWAWLMFIAPDGTTYGSDTDSPPQRIPLGYYPRLEGTTQGSDPARLADMRQTHIQGLPPWTQVTAVAIFDRDVRDELSQGRHRSFWHLVPADRPDCHIIKVQGTAGGPEVAEVAEFHPGRVVVYSDPHGRWEVAVADPEDPDYNLEGVWQPIGVGLGNNGELGVAGEAWVVLWGRFWLNPLESLPPLDPWTFYYLDPLAAFPLSPGKFTAVPPTPGPDVVFNQPVFRHLSQGWCVLTPQSQRDDFQGPNVVVEAAVPGHSWGIGNIVRWNGETWVLAVASETIPSSVVGVVAGIPDNDTVWVVVWGMFCSVEFFVSVNHTTYYVGEVPGVPTTDPPAENPVAVFHHVTDQICVMRSPIGGGLSALALEQLTNVDIDTGTLENGQTLVWNDSSEVWENGAGGAPTDPVEPREVFIGPISGEPQAPTFRLLEHTDLPDQDSTSVLANAGGSTAPPEPLAAANDNTVLLRLSGSLLWDQMPGAVLLDNTVENVKLAEMQAATIKGRVAGGGPGSPQDLDAEQAITAIGAAAADHSHILGGDVTGGLADTSIANGVVTNPKLAGMAASTIKGRAAAAGTGPPQDLDAAQARAAISAAAAIHSHTLGGDVTGSLNATSIADGAVTEAKIADGAVTNAKLEFSYITVGGTNYDLGQEVIGIMVNPMTTPGDLIVGSTDGAPARLEVNSTPTVQILTSVDGNTALSDHTLGLLWDVTLANPQNNQVLTYDAESETWQNRAGGGGGATGYGTNPAFVMQIGDKVEDNTYNVKVFPEYPATTLEWNVQCTQLQGDTLTTIPSDTWTIGCGVLKAGVDGENPADYDYFMQVPIWM